MTTVQPITGGDGQRCWRRVGSRQTGIQEPSYAYLNTNSEPNPVDNVQPVCCRVEDKVKLLP